MDSVPHAQNVAPQVAVLLGTDRHPFDRAVSWTAALAANSDRTWLLQHGFTHPPDDLPAAVIAREILSATDLGDLLTGVDAVITHGGPGLIMEARAAGHHPIVIPRDPALGEHVDGHQQDFAARLAAEGSIRTVASPDELADALTNALAAPRPLASHGGTNPDTVAAFAAAVAQARTMPRVTALQRLVGRRHRT